MSKLPKFSEVKPAQPRRQTKTDFIKNLVMLPVLAPFALMFYLTHQARMANTKMRIILNKGKNAEFLKEKAKDRYLPLVFSPDTLGLEYNGYSLYFFDGQSVEEQKIDFNEEKQETTCHFITIKDIDRHMSPEDMNYLVSHADELVNKDFLLHAMRNRQFPECVIKRLIDQHHTERELALK